ncbi:glycosyltransferase [Mesobaculum littorinae]|uniref:Glycosyltransferase n=1 Tax=Mesobaculum littorinae TaxID=2486419 RepID=A0A438AG03_9RHOB|nr:glycosyltransferase [Mesobaculum littorinae]RVV97624.1 glycosyltransferase [Mesobaculum littorinae]
MAISFIVTTYNVLDYVSQCLESVAAVARPGDEVILVDDGSDDGTAEALGAFTAAGGFGDGVRVDPILLGVNTVGGVGIAGNIGLSAAQGDAVFFVDGDDWINPAGFMAARSVWDLHDHDILLTNYLTFDTANGVSAPPADNQLWAGLRRDLTGDDAKLQALRFIGVPWRKFYRRSFLEAHHLRFPEGDRFFEDNPFHWDVCCTAEHIGFVDRLTCFHRVNRPGQTLASTGTELIAFFDHFHTILHTLPKHDMRYERQACLWLLENMAWHSGRLSPAARPAYAEASTHALARVPDQVWADVRSFRPPHDPVWIEADRLRAGQVGEQLAIWDREDLRRRLDRMETQQEILAEGLEALRKHQIGTKAARLFREIRTQQRGGPDAG